MSRALKFIIPAGIILLTGVVLYTPLKNRAKAHLYQMTGTNEHPVKCTSCHLHMTRSGLVSKLVNKSYYSPLDLAVSPDGKVLYVVAEEGNSLLVVNTSDQKVTERIETGTRPHSIVLSHDGSTAYVSNKWSDNISVIDLVSLSVRNTLITGGGPAGLALSPDDNYLYVANSFSSDVSVIDVRTGIEIKRLAAGNNPAGVRMNPNGSKIFVTSRRTLSRPFGDTVRCELTVINDNKKRVEERRDILSAYLMENIAFTPEGDLAIMPLVRPKNNVPTIQIEKGWMMTEGIGIIEQVEPGRTIQLLLDEPNSFYADPYDIVITGDGKKAFVSHSGVNCISVIDIEELRKIIAGTTNKMLETYSDYLGLSDRFVVKRIPTGSNPKGLALSPDGKKLYVAERLQDRIAVINTETLETTGSIKLGGSDRITVARRGRQLLNNAGHTFQNQYSCYTCHPDEHEDGLVYNMASKDMGRNITNTQSLRNIGKTAPYKWNGKNLTVFRQDGIRFSTVLTRTEAFNNEDLDALSTYIMTGIANPPNLSYNPVGNLTESQIRGKAIFERTHDVKGKEIPVANRCVTCHPAPYYTNRQMADVGTLALTDDSILFDTPHLNNIFASPPYLHDGRAASLEEIWTIYGKTEQHGSVNDLNKTQLNDLIDYLKSLRDEAYELNAVSTSKAGF